MWVEPRLSQVPVEGGELLLARWGRGDRVVLASHGITANHRSFGELAAQLAEQDADITLYAVDHRGRAGSAAHPGPFGMAAHAEDLVQVLDHLDVGSATFVGHSMGTYVAVLAAERWPDRVDDLLLVDGGWLGEIEIEPGTDVEELIRSVIGPALDRLDRTFPSREAYLDYWRAHPAFQGDDFTDVVEAQYSFDAVPNGEGWRSSVRKEAVLADGGDIRTDSRLRTALERITQPTVVLWAPLGLLNEPPPYVPETFTEQVAPRLDHVTAIEVEGVNHYTLLTAPRGAHEVAAHLRSL